MNGTEVEEPWTKELRLGDVDFMGLLVNLSSPLVLEENQTAVLSIEAVLSGCLSHLGADSYEVRMPMCPCSSFFLSNMTFRFWLPEDATISALEPGGFRKKDHKLAYYQSGNITELTSEIAKIRFKVPEPIFLVDCPYMARTLELDPLSGIRITDSYELDNRRGPILDTVKVLLPKEAKFISARDELGPLKVRSSEKNGLKEVSISLRSKFGRGQHLSLTLSYVLPWPDLVGHEGLSSFTLNFSLSDGLSWKADVMFVKVVLPMGARLEACGLEPTYLRTGFLHEEVGFTLRPAVPAHAPRLVVEFSYSPLWPSLLPTLWASLAGLAGCLLVKLLAPAAPAVPVLAVPAEDIMKLVRAYERRMRLRGELESLREALRTRRISRRKFKTRSKAITDELSRLDREVSDLMSRLREAGGVISELIRDLEVAESELQSIERDLRSLEARYVRKEIGSEAYRRLLREYRRREDRARTAIREALLRLKELAT